MEQQQLVSDGATLALRVYTPEGPPRASVVIGGAMGVRQAFYEAFATWLAGQGYRVTSFDYRGHGDSLQGPLREVRADLCDWARDYEAVIAHAKAQLPDQPLFLVGHSLGAQLPGLLRAPQRVDGLLSVAAGSGYWRDNAPRLKRMVPYFWHVLVPVATRLCGYFPGRRLRKVGDLPAGVMLQWRRWCLDPRYSVGAEGDAAARSYAAVRFPVMALSMSDDELMTLRGTRHLFALYANAPSHIEHIEPKSLQLRRIGHFGFFRAEMREALWSRAEATLAAWVKKPVPAGEYPRFPSLSESPA
ncbi:Predicted hydrolase of the alpha/beta-hydrolase fold [Delftia tsuruhatensis]|uniref:alpha/beta hydrolase family protein n=1 Tax=Delftia tsuruhatensis TaxID=180282 RepID=UPI001E774A11|nr:alpha/beta fold hydrolase [Delftia tsuruhatensis]CAB5710126.1 Predicted hydrolase of the alpha/beta-hydrolase fold [Delftia tsuruhatensis]CAC9692062.1 Predicted hydrolase of the alpha/beta-hydrolase fold [Delftia tsuruhatensis]